ncbi:hypothetical protein [Undibacterium sp. Ji42W]|uniref:hypothetical protein n=1 Tax=Undibacterium sp. Ji42W TaxID=3413039 RepID=UPI003BF5A6B5
MMRSIQGINGAHGAPYSPGLLPAQIHPMPVGCAVRTGCVLPLPTCIVATIHA